MMHRRFALFASVALLTACGGASTTMTPAAESAAMEVSESAVNVTETWDRSQPPEPGTPRPFALPDVR